MKKCTFSLISIIFFTFVLSAEARVYLDIHDPALVQIPIVLTKWKPVEKTPATLTGKVYEILAEKSTRIWVFVICKLKVHRFFRFSF